MPPTPKPPALRQRRNKTSTHAMLTGAPARECPLPARADGTPWRPEALQVWAEAWASPMAAEYLDADVPGLLVIVELTHRFWTGKTDPRIAAELRQARIEYGLSPMARRRLQWEISKVKQAEQRQAAPRTRRVKDPRSVLRAVQ